MNLCNCLSPVLIPDPKCPSRNIMVPCGHCEICRNRRSQDWIHRLEVERSCWQYCVFYTLTYDDNHLPCVHLVKLDGEYRLCDCKTGSLFEYKPLRKELPFIRKMRRVSYVDVRDHQLFIKRLRYYFYEYNKENRQTSNTLRYFSTYEYGPTTHRVHIHGLLFFNDRKGTFAAKIGDYINQSWSNGFADTSFVQSGSATKYVAKYCSVDLSKRGLYSSPEFRVRHLQSKCPPIGTMLINQSCMLELFRSQSLTINVQVSDSITTVPLPLFLKGRLWPKCPRFNQLSFVQLVGMYSISKWPECSTLDATCEYVTKLLRSGLRYSKDTLPYHLLMMLDSSNVDPYASVKRLWRISRRVLLQCEIFGVTLREYLKNLCNYYEKVEFENLRTWYELQEQAQHMTPALPIQVWPSVDLSFIELVESTPLDDMPLWVLSTLDGYHLDPILFITNPIYRNSYDYRNYPLASSYINRTINLYRETSKIKAKKDYERLNGYLTINQQYAKYF